MSDAEFQALPPLRDVIARYDLMARKSLGQHFLCDLNLTRRIAECAGDVRGCTVFEIGPGPGGLTRALLGTDANKIIAIEKDRRCIAALADLVDVAEGRLEVIEGNALKTDLTKLGKAPRPIVANLPYNIGTELLIGWLKQMPAFRSLTLMFQKEVAQRLVAEPGSKAYGRLSVLAQFCCAVEHALDIPARAFTPPPKVSSSVVRLTPRKDRPANVTIESIEKITAAAFGQRRKMLRSSLRMLGGEDLLQRAGINPELRAENLTVEDFENLARLIPAVA
jgi:16S rRNA (adenine1518-N6/adenine1519-N6)-dimethyltransferase